MGSAALMCLMRGHRAVHPAFAKLRRDKQGDGCRSPSRHNVEGFRRPALDVKIQNSLAD